VVSHSQALQPEPHVPHICSEAFLSSHFSKSSHLCVNKHNQILHNEVCRCIRILSETSNNFDLNLEKQASTVELAKKKHQNCVYRHGHGSVTVTVKKFGDFFLAILEKK
jgi:hypothetical protein